MELKHYLQIAGRWAWLLILGAILGAAGGYYFSQMQEPVYPERLLQEDRAYCIKKLGLDDAGFEAIMASPNRTFMDYRTSRQIFERAKRMLNSGRKLIG